MIVAAGLLGKPELYAKAADRRRRFSHFATLNSALLQETAKSYLKPVPRLDFTSAMSAASI